jgi:hypothetical protein
VVPGQVAPVAELGRGTSSLGEEGRVGSGRGDEERLIGFLEGQTHLETEDCGDVVFFMSGLGLLKGLGSCGCYRCSERQVALH